MQHTEKNTILKNEQERMRLMLESVPLCCNLWDTGYNNIGCNQEAVTLFELKDKQEYLERFFELSPEYQPDGRLSSEKATEKIRQAFDTGQARFKWMHCKLNGEPVPSEIILVRVAYDDGYLVAGYTRDMREIKAAEAEANKAIEQMRIMFDAVPLCCNLWDKDHNTIDCNQEAVTLFELKDKREYLDRFFELSPEYQPDGRLSSEKAAQMVSLAFDTGWTRFEWMHRKLNGEPIPAEVILVRVKDDTGYVVAGYTRDLREIKAAEAEANKATERMRLMFDAVPLCCNLWDKDHNNIGCNQEAVTLFELKNKQEYLDRFFELSPEYQPDGRLSSEKAGEMISRAFDTGWVRFEWMHCKLNGEPVPAEVTLVRLKDDTGYVVAGYTLDLREIKWTVSRLNRMEQLAFTDAVTGIANRYHFMDNAQKAFINLSPSRAVSIMMIDLDHFKDVNDTYGHTAGDIILKSVAGKIQETLRESDFLARYGGEEFIVIVDDVNEEMIRRLAERLRLAVCDAPFDAGDVAIPVTISIGAAIRKDPLQTLEELIEQADTALYRAKAKGRNRVEML